MKCPVCQNESPALQGRCPFCGVPFTVTRESLGKRHPALFISITLLSFIVLLATVGYAGYHFLHKKPSTQGPGGGLRRPARRAGRAARERRQEAARNRSVGV